MSNSLDLDWQKNADGLLPAIIQDARTAEVLMLGFMNRVALQKTLETGFVNFYSRTKKRLWMKGETSGNTLSVQSVNTDCDRDTILIQAVPAGPTCHTGSRSCFGNDESTLTTFGLLVETIRDRSKESSDDSYTSSLLRGGRESYGAKVLEEAEEVVRASKEEGKQRTIEEAADLLYHTLVLLRGEGIELEDVAVELRKRRRE